MTDQMPTIYLREKLDNLARMLPAVTDGEIRTDHSDLDWIRLNAQSVIDEIDKWRGASTSPTSEVVEVPPTFRITHTSIRMAGHDLEGERIATTTVRDRDFILRSRVHRNAYDAQSWCNVAVLTDSGEWSVIATTDVVGSPVGPYTYVHDSIDGVEWREAMDETLLELLKIGRRVLG